MDIQSIDKAVCKTVRSLGYSPKHTHRIVDGVHNTLQNNGPEWLLSRVKDLRSYYSGDGDFPGWIKHKTRSDGLMRPKGWMGSIVGPVTKPKTAITALSTVIGAIRFDDPTDKQLSKWKDAVINPPTPTDVTEELGFLRLPGLEKALGHKLEKIKPFGPDDIHGSRIPLGYEDMSIARGQNTEVSDVYFAFRGSVESAPSAAWVFQDQSGVRIPGISIAKSRPILNSLRKGAPDSGKTKSSRRQGKSGRPLRKLEDYPVGHISFLQEPFGKLRTVANPNRFVQWQLEPVGQVLSDWVNSQPGVYVLDQEEGISWIQRQLGKGTPITSMDLSSASDTLDFVQITEQLRKSGPEMDKHLEYFERVSKMPWFVSNEMAQSFVGSDTISWTQGQPLGLRPSFPVLTITNYAAARAAVIRVDGQFEETDPPFAIVGDDIAIQSKYAKEYSNIIGDLGGVANLEKSMESNCQAEFCSRLIRPDEVIRLKVRYLEDNDPQNILSYQESDLKVNLKPWVRKMAKRVGSYSLYEYGLVPNYHPDQPKSLDSKVLFHVGNSLFDKGKRTKFEMSSHTMFYAALEMELHPTSRRKKSPQKRKRPTPSLLKASRSVRFEKFHEWNPSIDLASLPIELGLVKARYRNSEDYWKDQALKELERSGAARARLPGVKWPRDPMFFEETLPLEEASAREQMVELGRSSFSYKEDRRLPDQHPDTALSRLNDNVDKFERDLIQDSSGSHLIRRVGPGVDALVEQVGTDFELSYHSESITTPPEKVGIPEKDVPTHLLPAKEAARAELIQRLKVAKRTQDKKPKSEYSLDLD